MLHSKAAEKLLSLARKFLMEAIVYRAELLFMTGTGEILTSKMAFNVWKVNGNSDIFIILPSKSALSFFFWFFFFFFFFF